MYSCEPLHTDKQVLGDQLDPINNRCSLEDRPGAMDDRDEWQERSGKSVLAARDDDDDDDDIYVNETTIGSSVDCIQTYYV